MSLKIAKISLIPIKDILSYKFFIPSYQRGYRWTARQVNELLDDIWAFRLQCEDGGKKDSYYCLQPIVVSKKEDEYVVLDGQQRLTTIYLILKALKEYRPRDKTIFSIQYETRPKSGDFLEKIDPSKCSARKDDAENIDYYHIEIVFDAISKWFKEKDETVSQHFLATLLNGKEYGKNVQFIWYDVTDENTNDQYGIDIFTRINMGKIPLTNAELIKALFLQKNNFTEASLVLQQLRIASEWDSIEKSLQNDAFWFFIYNPNCGIKYVNRIEYIFDLMHNRDKESEDHFTFHQFSQAFLSKKTTEDKAVVEDLWLEVKGYFQHIEEWFTDNTLYHLIGFLIATDNKNNIVNALKNDSKETTKTEFLFKLRQQICAKFKKCDIDGLEYLDPLVKPILLLFNIQTIIKSGKDEMRFPFDRYKNGEWDIEHISSQTTKIIDESTRMEWARDILEYLTGFRSTENISIDDNEIAELVDRLSNFIKLDTVGDPSFTRLYEDIKEKFKEDEESINTDSISNLTLLDAHTNRSYGNAFFPIKRMRIIQNDMTGIFVPLCTKNVFLKSYSRQLGDVMYWKNQDASAYLRAMKTTLEEYLPDLKVTNV